MAMPSLLLFLVATSCPGIPGLRVISNNDVLPSESHSKSDEATWGGVDYEGVFTEEEERILQALEVEDAHNHYNTRAHNHAHGMEFKQKIGKETDYSVTFVYLNGARGTTLVRGHEATSMLGMKGVSASHMLCDEFCAKEHDNKQQLVVHIQYQCQCALADNLSLGKLLSAFNSNGQVDIYDPVDKEFNFANEVNKGLKIYAGTAKMRDQLNSIKDNAAYLLPHHHSNFQNRRISMFETSSPQPKPLKIVIAGDFNDENQRQRLAQCLKNTLDGTNLARVDPVAKFLTEVPCDTAGLEGPSIRGDCFAQKLAQFDIGIAWVQQEKAANFLIKPPQRAANMLAVGLPVVADGRYEGHKDIASFGHDAVRLASSEDMMCKQVAELVSNDSLRRKASEEALKVAENYSPSSIADQYIKSFELFKR